jgi:hypothetical protein
MYSNLHFAITLLGIFSIFEIFKGGQKLSVLKYHILARLLMIVAGSFFDYLALDGYEIPYYHEIFRLIAAVLFVNMLFLIVRKQIKEESRQLILYTPKETPIVNYEGFLKIEKVNFIILYSYIFLPNHHFHY